MEIEGLHGETDGTEAQRGKAQQLIDGIIGKDRQTRALLNKQLHVIEQLAQIIPAAKKNFLAADLQKLHVVQLNLDNRASQLLHYASVNGWTVKTQQLTGRLINFSRSVYSSVTDSIKTGTQEVKNAVSNAWNWLFGNDTKGLGELTLLAVAGIVVLTAGVTAALIYELQKTDGKATQDHTDLKKYSDLVQRALSAGLITKQQADAINNEVDEALQREHEAGARNQWWKSVGTVAKIGIPLLAGIWLVVDGIPRFLAYQDKRKYKSA